jgi:hypothetical protein
VVDPRTSFEEYVDWYSWARANLAGDALACSATATASAATRVGMVSADRAQARPSPRQP